MTTTKFTNDRTSVEDFHSLHEVHRSAGGTVYTAYHKSDRSVRYILKERKVPELGRAKDLMNEVHLLSKLDDAYVVQCHGWFYTERTKSLWLVLEYCEGGDLSRFIGKHKTRKVPIPEEQVWNIFHQICLGVKCLHEHGIIHRDLKSLNVLCCDDRATRVKIGDLGVSRQMSNHTELLNSRYGTPLYLSPELVDEHAKGYTEKTDIWSLGVVLYELAALDTPFMSDSLMGLARKILNGKYAPIPSSYSEELSACISWLLCRDPANRPSISQLCRYLEEAIDAAAALSKATATTAVPAADAERKGSGNSRVERGNSGAGVTDSIKDHIVAAAAQEHDNGQLVDDLACSDTDSEGSFDTNNQHHHRHQGAVIPMPVRQQKQKQPPLAAVVVVEGVNGKSTPSDDGTSTRNLRSHAVAAALELQATLKKNKLLLSEVLVGGPKEKLPVAAIAAAAVAPELSTAATRAATEKDHLSGFEGEPTTEQPAPRARRRQQQQQSQKPAPQAGAVKKRDDGETAAAASSGGPCSEPAVAEKKGGASSQQAVATTATTTVLPIQGSSGGGRSSSKTAAAVVPSMSVPLASQAADDDHDDHRAREVDLVLPTQQPRRFSGGGVRRDELSMRLLLALKRETLVLKRLLQTRALSLAAAAAAAAAAGAGSQQHGNNNNNISEAMPGGGFSQAIRTAEHTISKLKHAIQTGEDVLEALGDAAVDNDHHQAIAAAAEAAQSALETYDKTQQHSREDRDASNTDAPAPVRRSRRGKQNDISRGVVESHVSPPRTQQFQRLGLRKVPDSLQPAVESVVLSLPNINKTGNTNARQPFLDYYATTAANELQQRQPAESSDDNNNNNNTNNNWVRPRPMTASSSVNPPWRQSKGAKAAAANLHPRPHHQQHAQRQFDIFHRGGDYDYGDFDNGLDHDKGLELDNHLNRLLRGATLAADDDDNNDDIMATRHKKKNERGVAQGQGLVRAQAPLARDDLALVDLFRKHLPKPSPYPCFTEQEQAIFPERAPKPRRQKFRTIVEGELLPIYDAK